MFRCLALVYAIKEKLFMTLIKDHKADFIQTGGYYNEVL